MSIKLMQKAWESNIKGNELLVLLSLADNASDEGYCWPSWSTIMKKTKVSKGTLSSTLKALEYKGLISRESRKRANGSHASNGYYVLQNNQSSEVEHHSGVQKLNYQSSEVEHLESSGESSIKKYIKSNILNEYIAENKPDQSNIDWASWFINHRKTIKRPIKTTKPIIMFIKSVVDCMSNGYTAKEIIDLMEFKEWQSVKLEWVQKEIVREKEWGNP